MSKHFGDSKQRFSIRKFSFGAASVAVASFFALGGTLVQADEVDGAQLLVEDVTQEIISQSEVAEIETVDSSDNVLSTSKSLDDQLVNQNQEDSKVTIEQVNQAQVAVVSAQNNLSSAQQTVSNAQANVSSKSLAVNKAQDTLTQAQSNNANIQSQIIEIEDDIKTQTGIISQSQVAVNDAQTTVDNAQSRVTQSQANVNLQTSAVAEAQKQVDLAQIEVDNAQAFLGSLDEAALLAQKNLAQAKLNESLTNLQAAQDALVAAQMADATRAQNIQTAQANLQTINAQVTEAQNNLTSAQNVVTVAEAALVQAQKAVDEAQAIVDRTVIDPTDYSQIRNLLSTTFLVDFANQRPEIIEAYRELYDAYQRNDSQAKEEAINKLNSYEKQTNNAIPSEFFIDNATKELMTNIKFSSTNIPYEVLDAMSLYVAEVLDNFKKSVVGVSESTKAMINANLSARTTASLHVADGDNMFMHHEGSYINAGNTAAKDTFGVGASGENLSMALLTNGLDNLTETTLYDLYLNQMSSLWGMIFYDGGDNRYGHALNFINHNGVGIGLAAVIQKVTVDNYVIDPETFQFYIDGKREIDSHHAFYVYHFSNSNPDSINEIIDDYANELNRLQSFGLTPANNSNAALTSYYLNYFQNMKSIIPTLILESPTDTVLQALESLNLAKANLSNAQLASDDANAKLVNANNLLSQALDSQTNAKQELDVLLASPETSPTAQANLGVAQSSLQAAKEELQTIDNLINNLESSKVQAHSLLIQVQINLSQAQSNLKIEEAKLVDLQLVLSNAQATLDSLTNNLLIAQNNLSTAQVKLDELKLQLENLHAQLVDINELAHQLSQAKTANLVAINNLQSANEALVKAQEAYTSAVDEYTAILARYKAQQQTSSIPPRIPGSKPGPNSGTDRGNQRTLVVPINSGVGKGAKSIDSTTTLKSDYSEIISSKSLTESSNQSNLPQTGDASVVAGLLGFMISTVGLVGIKNRK